MNASIREMRRSDIPTVTALERVIYPQPWSARLFFDELGRDDRSYLVIESPERDVLGYGGLLLIEQDAHITSLTVAPAQRGRRLGTRLLLALIERALERGAQHLTLEVRVSNTSAQGLYDRFGFAPVGKRKDYYIDEDALVMWAIDIDTDAYAERIAGIRESLEAYA
jgi:ribosomal-protein-alanine N-acetyltransferase